MRDKRLENEQIIDHAAICFTTLSRSELSSVNESSAAMSAVSVAILVQMIVLASIIVLALIYLVPIVVLRRFHTHNHIFTANLCIAAIFCSGYRLTYYLLLRFSPQVLWHERVCVAIGYLQMMSTHQVSLTMVGTSIYRLMSVVYHKRDCLTKRRCLAICVSIQWLTGVVLALPQISLDDSVSEAHLFYSKRHLNFHSHSPVGSPRGRRFTHSSPSSSFQR